MYVLGISAFYHDSAACLVCKGEIVAAAQEERFTRRKHDAGFPKNAIKYCLDSQNIDMSQVEAIAYYDNPFLTLERFLHNVLVAENKEDFIETYYEKIFSEKIWVKKIFEIEFPEITVGTAKKFFVLNHHMSHAASAFYPSPYKSSIIMTLDGVGEWTTLSIGVGKGNKISLLKEIRYPHSLGLFYSAFAYFCGFKVNSGEYKFMGLAPYGDSIYYDLICDNIIDIKEDGSFCLNLSYFDFQNGRTMINEKKFSDLFGGCKRKEEDIITKREMDIASSVQKIVSEIIIKIAKYAKNEFGEDITCICLAGGVALNCVANGELVRSGLYDNVWIQPAADDAGGALGAALYTYYYLTGEKREPDGVHDYQKGSYLGPKYETEEIKEFLNKNNYTYHIMDAPYSCIASLLNRQMVIGYFAGRMEFGPRALGHRSILADPRSPLMQSRMNLKIKYRESFRPFAPSVLIEDATNYFDIVSESPYMLVCSYVKKDRRLNFDRELFYRMEMIDLLQIVNQPKSDIPAVTHIDYSARVQTVDGIYNKDYYQIIEEFKKMSGCSVIVNTSFNVRGEPIVCSLQDAYDCFMNTEMDALVLENILILKEEQQKKGKKRIYELD